MSLSARVVGGFAIGIAAGALLHATGNPALLRLSAFIEPFGTLWVNAIMMTVIPLVVSSLIVAVGSSRDAQAAGRLGGSALLLFALFAAGSAGITALVAPPLMAWLPIDSAAAASLRDHAAAVSSSLREAPSVTDWLVGLVPPNPIRAAADGSTLSLVIFAILLALAITRLAPEPRRTLIAFFQGIAGAMRVLVEWVLALAPFGVFAVALSLAARLGVTAAGAVGYYVILFPILCTVLTAALYPVVAVWGGVSVRRFSRAAAPAQAVAFSTRSSLASLPALIDGAERHLGLPRAVTGLCLPLAVSMFKFCAPVVTVLGVPFLGRLYGIDIEPGRFVEAALIAVPLSFATPGIPAGGILVAAPMLVAVGIPAEGIGVLVALDTIPDMFRTPANVTADLAVVAIVAHRLREERAPAFVESAPVAEDGKRRPTVAAATHRDGANV